MITGDVDAAVAAVAHIGHSSGWDMLAGIATVLRIGRRMASGEWSDALRLFFLTIRHSPFATRYSPLTSSYTRYAASTAAPCGSLQPLRPSTASSAVRQRSTLALRQT